MNLFISQDSYFFVHRYFIKFFENDNSQVIFVREKKRGILKKYKEIFLAFSIRDILLICILEFKYFLKLKNRKSELKKEYVNDYKLNQFLELKLKTKKFSKIISIGCPCKINVLLEKKYNLKIYNLHGGIIPFQKGRFSPIKAFNFKHKYIGSTIHEISDSFDDGNIISQNNMKVSFEETKTDYYCNVLRLSSELLEEFLKGNYKTLNKSAKSYFKRIYKKND